MRIYTLYCQQFGIYTHRHNVSYIIVFVWTLLCICICKAKRGSTYAVQY